MLLACANLLVPYLCGANESVDSYRLGIYTGLSQRFPDTNGVGWTDAIQYEVFKAAGFNVEVLEVPAKRLPVMLKAGDIDSFVLTRESSRTFEKQAGPIISSKHPVVMVSWYIYYDDTKGWNPSWPPDEIFKQKIGKSRDSSSNLQREFELNITSSTSFDSIVKMVNLGRADYWIDNKGGGNSLTTAKLLIGEGFSYKQLYQRGMYVYFRNNERGRRLKAIYDAGVESLIHSQNYTRVFYRGDKNWKDTKTVDATMDFIGKHFPDLTVPDQLSPER